MYWFDDMRKNYSKMMESGIYVCLSELKKYFSLREILKLTKAFKKYYE